MQGHFSDILIVGGGMTGSALACALSLSKLFPKITVLDAVSSIPQSETKIPDPRVVTLTPASQSFMSSIGTWDLIPEHLKTRFQGMSVWDYYGTGSMHFQDSFGWVVENREIVSANLKRLESLGVEVLAPVKIKTIERKIGEVLVELEDGRVLETGLIVGADGKDSRVRGDLGIGVWRRSYPQNGLVCVVRAETSTQTRSAYQRFLQTGPVALLPLRDDFVSVVWSAPADIIKTLSQMSEEDFVAALNTALASPPFVQFPTSGQVVAPRILEVSSKRFGFPYALTQASSFVQPRLALVGDAAHTIHPMAGQGYNLGVYDVANLADVLCRGARLGRDPGDLSLLQDYAARARAYNSMFAVFEEGILMSFCDVKALHYLRNLKYAVVNNVGLVKQMFMRGANGFDFIPKEWEWEREVEITN